MTSWMDLSRDDLVFDIQEEYSSDWVVGHGAQQVGGGLGHGGQWHRASGVSVSDGTTLGHGAQEAKAGLGHGGQGHSAQGEKKVKKLTRKQRKRNAKKKKKKKAELEKEVTLRRQL